MVRALARSFANANPKTRLLSAHSVSGAEKTILGRGRCRRCPGTSAAGLARAGSEIQAWSSVTSLGAPEARPPRRRTRPPIFRRQVPKVSERRAAGWRKQPNAPECRGGGGRAAALAGLERKRKRARVLKAPPRPRPPFPSPAATRRGGECRPFVLPRGRVAACGVCPPEFPLRLPQLSLASLAAPRAPQVAALGAGRQVRGGKPRGFSRRPRS